MVSHHVQRFWEEMDYNVFYGKITLNGWSLGEAYMVWLCFFDIVSMGRATLEQVKSIDPTEKKYYTNIHNTIYHNTILTP